MLKTLALLCLLPLSLAAQFASGTDQYITENGVRIQRDSLNWVSATDPGCTYVGRTWTNTATSTTVYNVCNNVAGVLTWVANGGGGSTTLVPNSTPCTGCTNGYLFGTNGTVLTQNSLAGWGIVGGAAPLLNISGTNTTTTGTMSVSSTMLTVASLTGWAVGMGIAIANAGTGGNTELITSVVSCGTNVSGAPCASTTFVLASPSIAAVNGQTVHHDDTAVINTAIQSGLFVHLTAGTYNVTCSTAGGSSTIFAVNSPITFFGDGVSQTIINNRCSTGNIFNVGYDLAGSPPLWKGASFRDFQISQDANVTPTSGASFLVAALSGGYFTTGLDITRIIFNNVWTAISVGAGQDGNWFTHLTMYNCRSDCIFISSPSPSGDDFWDSINIDTNVGSSNVNILQADTQEFSNVKINGASLLLSSSSPGNNTYRVRFYDLSIEGVGGQSCGVIIQNASNNIVGTQIVGGGIGLVTTAICNASYEPDLVVLSNLYDAANLGFVSYGIARFTGPFNSIGNTSIGFAGGLAQFEVRDLATDSGTTSGSLVVDPANHQVYLGRLSGTTGSSDNIVARNRLGTVLLNLNTTSGQIDIGEQSNIGDTTPTNLWKSGVIQMSIANGGAVSINNLKTTGSAGGKVAVCVDTSTGTLYASSASGSCAN